MSKEEEEGSEAPEEGEGVERKVHGLKRSEAKESFSIGPMQIEGSCW